MAKKLEVELTVDSAKARRSMQQGLSGVAAETPGAEAPGAAGNAASAMDRAAKAAGGLADGTERMNRQMATLVRSFAGIAGGMAASFAASQMREGPARDAVEYGGSALTGASAGMVMGSRFGPWGTAIGAIVGAATGAGKTWLEKDSARSRAADSFMEHEVRWKSNKEFADFMKGLTDLGDKSKSVAERLEEARAKLEFYKNAEPRIVRSIQESNGAGMFEAAAFSTRSLDQNRQYQSQLQSFIDSTERAMRDAPGMRENFSALDALSKLGASFGGGDGALREQLDVQKDTLKTLNRMESKMGTGGSTWQ